MEVAYIQAQRREVGARNANTRLRRSGFLPAVIYGHGKPPEHIALPLHETLAVLAHSTHVVALTIDGRQEQFLLKDVQYDHLQQTPIHLDLMRVDASEKVQVKVPIEFKGQPVGAQEGGSLIHVLADLDVECTVLNIPGAIRVRVEHLKLGDTLFVKDLTLPPDVTVKHEPDEIVAVCRASRGPADELAATAAAPVEGEAATGPEIIKRGKTEEEAPEA